MEDDASELGLRGADESDKDYLEAFAASDDDSWDSQLEDSGRLVAMDRRVEEGSCSTKIPTLPLFSPRSRRHT